MPGERFFSRGDMRTFIVGLISIPALWAAPAVTTVCASGCDQSSLQIAINNAAAASSGPQVIVLKAGETFDTASGFTLPTRSGSYTGWITLRSSRVSELPATTRVAPTDTAKMATLRVTAGGYTPVLYTNGHPSSYWQLEGLEFTLSTASLAHQGWLIGLGYGIDGAETEPSKVSHHIVIDRCYIHGIAFDNGPRDGIRVNGDNIQVLNSYISEIKRDDRESHALTGYSLNGPLLVRNTFHGGAAIGSLIGGSPSTNVSIQPNNLQFLGNHYQGTPTHRALRYAVDPQGTSVPATGVDAQVYWKTDTSELYLYASGGWRKIATGITGSVCVDGDFWENTTGPTYLTCTGGVWVAAGGNRTITGGTATPFTHFWSKNRFELKKVTGALVEGNLLENCFSPTDEQQACSAFLLNWVTDQDGPWSTLRNISIRNNLIRRTVNMYNEGIINSARIGDFLQRWPYDITVDNNLVQDGTNPGVAVALNKVTYYNFPPVGGGFGAVGVTRYSHSRFTHNTLVNPLASETFWPNGFIYSEAASVGRQVSDNIFETGRLVNAASWLGGGGCASFSGHWTSTSFRNNLAVQSGQSIDGNASTNYDTADCRTWAFPWKRTGTGVWQSVTAASIAGGVLTITFGTSDYYGHGLLQGTKVKLAGWTPSGLNGTYTVPRLWCASGSTLTWQLWQRTLCLPTAETGAVTPGTIEASAGYTDWSAQNFRLASTSAYKGWATDGSDPGANQDMVEWATAGTESGVDNPYLDFRVRSISPTADGAVLRFTAYSTAACTWTISSTRAFADSLGAVSQSRAGRDGAAAITGLASSTGYWYRVACDSKLRDGEFVSGR
jgi:hypothetical protein